MKKKPKPGIEFRIDSEFNLENLEDTNPEEIGNALVKMSLTGYLHPTKALEVARAIEKVMKKNEN